MSLEQEHVEQLPERWEVRAGQPFGRSVTEYLVQDVARPRLRSGLSVAARGGVPIVARVKKQALSANGQGEPFMVTAPEAAKLLAISERLLWELTNRGAIPCVRFNRSVRYSIHELKRIAAGGVAASTAASGGSAP